VLRDRKSGSASVGMTNLRAVTHLGMDGGGWTESTLHQPIRFRWPPSFQRITVDFSKVLEL
jgi:hypothetical protein